jgi:hypothetical protein
MRVLVILPTTGALNQIVRLTGRPGLKASFVVMRGDYRPLAVSKDYDALTDEAGPLAKLAPLVASGPYEMRVSGNFDSGKSWELPVVIAHMVVALGAELVDDPAEAELILWSTGAVDLDLGIVPQNYSLPAKLALSKSTFQAGVTAGARIQVFLPPDSDPAPFQTMLAEISAARASVDVVDHVFDARDWLRTELGRPAPKRRSRPVDIDAGENPPGLRRGRRALVMIALAGFFSVGVAVAMERGWIPTPPINLGAVITFGPADLPSDGSHVADKAADPSAVKPAVVVADKPADPPVEKPAEAIIEKPADPPAGKPAHAAAEKPVDPPVAQPADVVADKPAEPPMGKPADAVADKPADPPVEKPADAVADKPADPPVEKPAEAVAEKPVDPPVGKPADAVAERPVDPSVGKPADAVAERPADPPVGKPTDALAERPADPPGKPAEVIGEKPGDPSTPTAKPPRDPLPAEAHSRPAGESPTESAVRAATAPVRITELRAPRGGTCFSVLFERAPARHVEVPFEAPDRFHDSVAQDLCGLEVALVPDAGALGFDVDIPTERLGFRSTSSGPSGRRTKFRVEFTRQFGHTIVYNLNISLARPPGEQETRRLRHRIIGRSQ